MTSKKLLLLSLFSGISLLLGYFLPNEVKEQSRQFQLNQFQESFLETETQLVQELEAISRNFSLDQPASYFENLDKLDQERKISFYVFHHNDLVFWSDDNAAFNSNQLKAEANLLKLGNGWYYKQSLKKQDSLFVGLLLIQSEFDHQNKYLRNKLQPDFEYELIENIRPPSNYGYSIHNNQNEIVFDLQLKSNEDVFDFLVKLQSIAILLGFGLLLFVISQVFKSAKQGLISSTVAILVIRILLFCYPPSAWTLLDFFNPNLYAYSSWMPTFGDFILNGLVLFFIAYQLIRNYAVVANKWLSIVILFLAVILGNYTMILINGSIQNSTINFNLNNLFDLNYISFLSLFVFGIILFSIIILIDVGVKTSLKSWSKSMLIGIYAVLCLLTIFLSITNELHWSIHFWTIIPFLLLLISQTKFRPTISILLMLVFISAITAIIINYASQKRESEKRNIIIQKLAEEKDPVAEYLFDNIQEKIRVDTFLSSLLVDYQNKHAYIDAYLKEQYFSGYWKKYSILFTLCQETDTLFVNPSNSKISCLKYYQDRIRFEGDLISSSNLFQLRNLAGRIDYIAQIEMPIDSSSINLFIEMSANMFNQNKRLP